MTQRFRLLTALMCAVFLHRPTLAQDAPAAPQGLPAGQTRESMWWAPSAEDWKRPCLITWQRTYEDAVAVSKQTGKPILICVNMDGEPASEHYAGVRYRQPDIAKLYSPYVAVIASVYRHTPRDWDERGNRILCPRFGSVTCGEHIAIEPALFEQFFDGKRIAPRHIMVELEKESAETYDIYYAFDTDTIFDNLRSGIANRPPPKPEAGADRELVDRVASRDIADRIAVEQAYKQGDVVLRRKLLESAQKHTDLAPTEILRLALFGFDLELARSARRTLAQATTPDAVELIAEALRVPMDPAERDALIAALVRLGEISPRAQTLAAVYKGLAARSSAVDLAAWSKALESATAGAPPVDSYELGARMEGRVHAASSRPADSAARLELAEGFLALAVDPATSPKFSRLMLADARDNALEAEKLGASGWRVNAVLATTAVELGDLLDAQKRAEAAMADLPADVQSYASMRVLALYAQTIQQKIAKAVREKREWPPQWLTDVHATYAVLARHPLASDRNVTSHYDFLKYLSATVQADGVLDEGLKRFPDSPLLHDRLRTRLLDERGVAGLEAGYAERLAKLDASPNLEWYAGYASLVAAEFRRRTSEDAEALSAYDRGIAHFERAAEKNPANRDSADHFIALALAGRARLALEAGDLEGALRLVRASFEKRPTAAATMDGLNFSPVDTAKLLLARLKQTSQLELAQTLQAALDALDPLMLQPPAYEPRGNAGRPPDAGRPRPQGQPAGG